jgi:hypothetical protein
MAFGMRHWLGVVGVGVALASILSLPPASLERPTPENTRLPEEARAEALQARLTRVNATLRVDRTAADLVPATLAAPDGLTIRGTDRASDSLAADIRPRVHEELADAAVTTHDVALGVFVAGRPENDLPGGSPPNAEYYWGTRDGRAYCFTVLPLWETKVLSVRERWASVLGPCELIAKYGLPGPTVERWLGGPGEALAATATPLPRVERALMVQRYRKLYATLPRKAFGRTIGSSGPYASLAVEQCWAREGVGCAALIEHPPEFGALAGGGSSVLHYVAQHTALSAVERSTPLAPVASYVAADLAHEFGDARFETFWKADEPFSRAFESAFGTDLPGWSLAYFSPLLPAARAGPDVTSDAALGTVLLLALAAILGIVWARRRQVG